MCISLNMQACHITSIFSIGCHPCPHLMFTHFMHPRHLPFPNSCKPQPIFASHAAESCKLFFCRSCLYVSPLDYLVWVSSPSIEASTD